MKRSQEYPAPAQTPDLDGFTRPLLEWQRSHGRHDLPWQRQDAYAVHVSEIMLQQTQVATVLGYFERFMARFPTVRDLAGADQDEVMARWQGLGYYSRARNLHAAAKQVVETFGGGYPGSPEELASLKGVGRSTAAAIASLAFHRRAAICDGNVKRVLARHAGVAGHGAAFDKAMWALAEARLPDAGAVSPAYAAWTQTVMDFGALWCTPKRPKCEACPVRGGCVAFREDRVAALPSPKPKKTVPERAADMVICRYGDEVLLQKNPDSGVWGGLWVLPERVEGAGEPARLLDGLTHVFTHFKLHIRPRLHLPESRPPAGDGRAWWPLAAVLDGAVAVPTPVRQLLLPLADADAKDGA